MTHGTVLSGGQCLTKAPRSCTKAPGSQAAQIELQIEFRRSAARRGPWGYSVSGLARAGAPAAARPGQRTSKQPQPATRSETLTRRLTRRPPATSVPPWPGPSDSEAPSPSPSLRILASTSRGMLGSESESRAHGAAQACPPSGIQAAAATAAAGQWPHVGYYTATKGVQPAPLTYRLPC